MSEPEPIFTFTVRQQNEAGELIEIKREVFFGNDELAFPPRHATWPTCECPTHRDRYQSEEVHDGRQH
ncbi:hypothetical protein OG455_14170 [Kitasatospora sp. NBC_01287]|uniref:hypothetical protein n=1 Tax=Kitasatospora sp. NBC_01287 TaxID=2903573 RepID=UPI002252FDBC|nr:hypothetical protein [Kitasatospora sp. NBC_01287]MCX4746649.1 hypothetical protein [Kitasatospora sp. NBC_01287]